MPVPGCTNSNLASWLRCKLCGGFFSQLSEFIQHKQQWHLADFQRTNSHSIVFEEVIPNGNQQSNVNFQNERKQVDSSAESFQFQFAQKVQVGKTLEEDFSASSVSVTVSQYGNGNTNEEEEEIAHLITFDENFEHQVDVANEDKNYNLSNLVSKSLPGRIPTVSKTEKIECSKLQNLTDSAVSSRDSIANASLPQVRLKRLTLQQIETANSTHKNCKTSRNFNSQKGTCSQLFKKNSCGNTTASNLNSKLKTFKCVHPGCSKSFKTRYHYKKHFAVHSKLCSVLNCKSTKKVIKKSKRPQFVVKKQEKSARPFSCPHPDCFSTFTAKRSLQRHAVTHMDHIDRPVFICEICKHVYWYKDNLKTHYKILHQEGRPDRPFKCMINDCSASYNWKRLLQKHEKRHT